MHSNEYIAALAAYAEKAGLTEACDRVYTVNRLLEIMQLDSCEPCEAPEMPLEDILQGLLQNAVSRGICEDDVTSRDLFDTKLMGALTPAPREVRAKFAALYAASPKAATDWYYRFAQSTDYIRSYRIKKDMRWQTQTEYGALDITINLSKPEKDPKAIAAAKSAPQSGYPKCLLCAENEGYAGRINHPARQNHRVIPLTLANEQWFMQYSPYVYYNEHCIVFSGEHAPMVINRETLQKLLCFVQQFPHYFIGSNADLPIVGGSILSHEHFQGGCYSFAMEKAPVETPITFSGYSDIAAGIVKWPMSVIRLTGTDKDRLCTLADKILRCWRGYSDEAAFIFAQTDGQPHNTVTPIARRRGDAFELDLVLRCNITTAEHPLGVYHPHSELHHIKKENIGLIEVMGLAVLPARLKVELAALQQVILSGETPSGELAKHARWVAELRQRHSFTAENTAAILREEVGQVFSQVLQHAGVYKRNAEGAAAFSRFIAHVNQTED